MNESQQLSSLGQSRAELAHAGVDDARLAEQLSDERARAFESSWEDMLHCPTTKTHAVQAATPATMGRACITFREVGRHARRIQDRRPCQLELRGRSRERNHPKKDRHADHVQGVYSPRVKEGTAIPDREQ